MRLVAGLATMILVPGLVLATAAGATAAGATQAGASPPLQAAPVASTARPLSGPEPGPEPRAPREPTPLHVAPLADAVARRACVASVAGGSGPLAVIVGASFTAGVGAGSVRLAWSVDLARRLGWRAVIVGVPGVGYQSVGEGGTGPLLRLLRLLGIARLDPGLVLVQAGHDDIGRSPATERARVASLVAYLERAAPEAQLAAITVFSRSKRPDVAARATDRAIVSGFLAADPGAVVMDPLTGGWSYARRGRGRLHPSAGGAEQIATLVWRSLAGAGVEPVATGAGGPEPAAAICALLPGAATRGARPAGAVPARDPDRDGSQYIIRASR